MAIAAPTARSSLAGIACMVSGGAVLSLNDTVVKLLTTRMPVGELIFLRAAILVLLILAYAWQTGQLTRLRIVDRRGQLLRALLLSVSVFLFVTALSLMPVADAIAIAFAGPLFVTALAPRLLGEHVGWRRWTAVCVGFAGVLLMTRTTGAVLYWVALVPLASSFVGALRDIVTRKISATESSLSILFFGTAAVAGVALLTWPLGWQPLSLIDIALLVLTGILFGAAQYLMIEAYRLAEAAVAAPFKYTTMIWAVALGYLFFGDLPDRWLLVGAAVVTASGLYILHRETQRGRS